MYIFDAKCNYDVKMHNFVDITFAKTFNIKFNSNFVQILNVSIIKIRFKIKSKNINIYNNFSNFCICIYIKRINDNISHIIKRKSIFFRIKKRSTIFKHVFVNMSNAEKHVNI